MKYKLILFNTYGSADVDYSANFTFYTFNAAHEAATAWAEASGRHALLWDGIQWRSYAN